jgi:hypothetical protein
MGNEKSGEEALSSNQSNTLNPAKVFQDVLNKFGFKPAAPVETYLLDETTKKIESDGFFTEAPLLSEILDDESRTNKLSYWKSDKSKREEMRSKIAPLEEEVVELTEHEALVELDEFLNFAAIELSGSEDPDILALSQEANKIRTELNYIGDKEIQAAAAGMAGLWKHYLSEDPKKQICVPQEIVRTPDYKGKKSSEYMYYQILKSFSPEELARYGKQIITDPRELKRDPKFVKIVILDDWSISGTQLGNAYGSLFSVLDPKYLDKVEINLAAATKYQLTEGRVQGRKLPIKSYFRINSKTYEISDYERPIISGTHSSVDFGFELSIEKIVKALNSLNPAKKVYMPPCTNILRTRY